MSARHAQWLIVLLCSSLGMACSHCRREHCAKPTVAPKPDSAKSTSQPNRLLARESSPKPKVAIAKQKSPPPKTTVPTIPSPLNVPDDSLAALPLPPINIPEIASAPLKLPESPVSRNSASKQTKPIAKRDAYDHARDFSWLVGQLQYLHAKRQWRVRYAPADVDDEFGGIVVLTGVEHLTESFTDGAPIALRGQLVDPDKRSAAPEYYAYEVQVLPSR